MPPESEKPLPSLTAARVVIVAGKGGVGKTTVTAVLARAAADSGQRVLVVELDGKPTLADLLTPVGVEVDGDGTEGGDANGGEAHDDVGAGGAAVAGSIEVVHLSAADALDEYLRDHGFRRIAERLSTTGVIDLVGTAAPGLDDVVVLGKVKQLERARDHDLILVDGPAAGHAITFLTSAAGLAEAARGGPVKNQSDEVLELLGDGRRAMVVLVTLPETTPVNETVETAFALEDRVGIRLGPVVVNSVDPGPELPDAEAVGELLPSATACSDVGDDDSDVGEAGRPWARLLAAADFRRSRRRMESDALDRLGERLPLRQVRLPALPVAGLDADDVRTLAGELSASGAIDPGSADSSRGGPR